MSKFPFRFYGHGGRPDERRRIEHGAEEHLFTMALSRAATEEERSLLGETFEEMLAEGRARAGFCAWQWSGSFTLFSVEERRGVKGSLVGEVEAFLLQVHALVPITDVVYANAAEGEDSWGRWSRQQGDPVPGPFRIVQDGACPRSFDNSLPTPTRDDAFERGRRALWRSEAKRELAQALDAQPGKGLRLALLDSAAPPRPARFEWSPEDLQAFNVPDPRVLIRSEGEHSWEEWQVGDHPLLEEAGRRLAWVIAPSGSHSEVDLAWIDDEGQRRTPKWKPASARKRLTQLALHPGGDHAVLCVTRAGKGGVGQEVALYRVDFQAGSARSWSLEPPSGYTFLHNGLLVLTGRRGSQLVDALANQPRVLSKVVSSESVPTAILDRRAVLIATKTGLSLFVLIGEALVKAGTVKGKVVFDYEHEGRVFMRYDDWRFELLGVEEIVRKRLERGR